MTNKELYSPLT